MEKLNLGQTITILANLGVIAGIAFLAIELNQNNRLLRAQEQHNLHENRVRFAYARMEDPAVAGLWADVLAGESVTGVERARMNAMFEVLVENWRYEYQQFRSGVLEERDLPIDGYRGIYSRLIRNREFQSYWARRSVDFDPAFVALIEAQSGD
jgi:hypothetical protein